MRQAWCVIAFSPGTNEGCGVDPEPIFAYGPFASHAEARECMKVVPARRVPHVLMPTLEAEDFSQ